VFLAVLARPPGGAYRKLLSLLWAARGQLSKFWVPIRSPTNAIPASSPPKKYPFDPEGSGISQLANLMQYSQ
jgi:hypothetical protein